ncbi:MAG: response regulator [Bdellovibrionales bacterium]|nr:response regulator [Bdellovibrionales bacterium]
MQDQEIEIKLENSPLILVAEDEALVREVAVMIIEEIGGRVLEAEDGLQAVELLKENLEEVKAVVLDFSMPRLDGFEAAKQIRDLNKNLPIIICSGLQCTKKDSDLEKLGLIRFIAKPYEMVEFLTALSSACAAAG